jgi:hypothetical protein
MRKINITIEIEDDDFLEYRVKLGLEQLLGSYMIDYKILPDTKELYETDSYFKNLCKIAKDAKKARENYAFNKKHK